MAIAVGTIVGAKSFLQDFYASAAFVAGTVVVREATVANLGEAAAPSSTTSATDVLGVTTEPVTSVVGPTREPGSLLLAAAGGLENIVRVDTCPFTIFRFQYSGGAGNNVALAPDTAAAANILINTVADSTVKTVVTSVGTGTVSMAGGLIKGRSGGNAGAIRKMISQVNSTSTTVGIGFVNTIGVGDTFIRVPNSRAIQTMQLNTAFTQANSIIATGTGAAVRTVNVVIDEMTNLAYVEVIFTLHQYNKNS